MDPDLHQIDATGPQTHGHLEEKHEPVHNEDQGEGFELDGDKFFDTRTTSDPSETMDQYWGMRFDSHHQTNYFFHFSSGVSQWDPPEQLVDRKTQQVVLWDDQEQWFYLYHLENGSSEWMSEWQVQEFFRTNNNPLECIDEKNETSQHQHQYHQDDDDTLQHEEPGPNNEEADDESSSIVSVATTDDLEESDVTSTSLHQATQDDHKHMQQTELRAATCPDVRV